MISAKELGERRRQCAEMFSRIGIVLTPREKESIEIADFGLGRFAHTGLGVLVYVNTDRVCAKELAMLPHQTCPEHRHPEVKGRPGKEETFRCRWGDVSIYVPGAPAKPARSKAPEGRQMYYTVWHEIH